MDIDLMCAHLDWRLGLEGIYEGGFIGNGEKVTYKSWKKKFRKMKFRFEHTMMASNILYKQEQEAAESARRLAIENDQLLDLLLDVNSSPQIPEHLRVDLTLDAPSINAVPQLVSDSLPTKCRNPEAQAILDHMQGLLDAKAQAASSNRPAKSLVSLMATVPHAPFEITTIPYDLPSNFPSLSEAKLENITIKHDQPLPVTYLSPDEVDEYISIADTALSLPPVPRLALASRARQLPPHLSDKDLQARNPNSVYNWLRRHEPRIFLQDGEGSEGTKSVSGKPGALRGAGKRASIPVPTRPGGPVEFVEEDGLGYDASLGGVGGTGKKDGKRKRASLDDAGYRPKGGASRPTKKKKKEGNVESTAIIEKKAGRGRVRIEVETEGTDNAGLGPERH